MRIGYSYWGFLGDHKLDADGNELSTPDGNATYSWSIIWEAQRRGHTVFAMQEDRDWSAYKRLGADLFSSFSQEKRLDCYLKMKHTFGSSEIMPELDVLLLEWRWPIPGRNCDPNVRTFDRTGVPTFSYNPFKHQPDWARQMQLLDHYRGTDTKIVLWDLDHKIERGDEQFWQPHAIFETSQTPLELSMKRTRVEPPFHIPDLLQHPTLPGDPNRKLVYIGSRYERDEVIDRWLGQVAERYPGQVEFHGKWDDEAKARWPNISMHPRCTVKDFRRIYGTAGACPLLAKQSYLETGFITPRPWEALLFGCVPVGLGDMKGVAQYVEPGCVAADPHDMIEITELVSGVDLPERDAMRRRNVELLEFMDAKNFLDRLEAV